MANPLDALVSPRPAKWDLDFKVPRMPRLSESMTGRQLKDAVAHHETELERWRQAVESSISDRLITLQTQTQVATTTAAAATSTTAVSADASLAARVAALEALIDALVNGKMIVLCSGITPFATGADVAEIEVPSNPDGAGWSIDRILFRVQTAGGAPSILIERSEGPGPFSAIPVGSVTLVTDANEGEETDSLGTISPGDKLRFNVTDLGTAENWTIAIELSL